MKQYLVNIPITGIISIEVEAGSESEAKEKAFHSEDLNLNNIEEWEAHKHVIQGNVFYGVLNEISVEEA